MKLTAFFLKQTAMPNAGNDMEYQIRAQESVSQIKQQFQEVGLKFTRVDCKGDCYKEGDDLPLK